MEFCHKKHTVYYLILSIILFLAFNCSDSTTSDFAKNIDFNEGNVDKYLSLRKNKLVSMTSTNYNLKNGRKRWSNIYECDTLNNELSSYFYFYGDNDDNRFNEGYTYKFDKNGKQILETYYDVWGEKTSDYHLIYNSEGVLIKGENGKIDMEILYEYIPSKNLVKKIYKPLKGSGDLTVTFYKFDESGRKIEEYFENVNYDTVYYIKKYIYNRKGQHTETISFNSDRKPMSKYIFKYNKEGLLTEKILFDSVGTPISKDIFKYSDEPSNLLKGNRRKFEKWLFQKTGVTEVHYESHGQVWITLESSKYYNKNNIKEIAEKVARWYAERIHKDSTVCTVWKGKEIYAKANFNK